MTGHANRQSAGKGASIGNLVRIMVSLSPDDMRRVSWLAQRRKHPVAKVLRDAVYAYMLPIAADADADISREAKAPAPAAHLQIKSKASP